MLIWLGVHGEGWERGRGRCGNLGEDGMDDEIRWDEDEDLLIKGFMSDWAEQD